MKIKNSILLLIMFLSVFFLTGCNNANGVETKAYAIALGVDNGDTNTLKLTLQIAVLNNSSNESSPEEAASIISVDCSTIDSGISLINSYISKKINLSHCKAIIISEELARGGLTDVIYSLINNIEIRPNCNIVISRCNAYDMLKNSNPVFESNPARYYELILNSTEYTGYIADLYISDFYSSILSSTSQACAILGGINTKGTHSSGSNNIDSLDGDYKADDTPIESKNHAEIMGSAVFRGDRLVGELTNLETLCHLIVTNNLESATITIPNPFDFNTNISIYISLNKRTVNSVKFINNFPYIESNVYLTGNVSSIDGSIDLTNSKTLEILNGYVNTYLERNISNYLYKTSLELKSDIAEFGKYVLPKYYNWNDWIASDWLNNYENASFKVNVSTEIQGGYLYTKI